MPVEVHHITNRTEWLSWRRKDIGASDVASVCGVGRRSALAVYAEKFGLAPPQADNEAMKKGRWLEAAVFEALAETYPDWDLRRANVYLRDPVARLGATPDGVATIPGHEGITIVQCKVVSRPIFDRDWHEDPDDKASPIVVPLGYQLQTLTEAMLAQEAMRADPTSAVVAALVHDTFTADLHILPVERHPEAEAQIRHRVAGFWADVDAGRQPAVDPSKDAETVKALYAKDNGAELDLTADNEATELCDERAACKAIIKEAETRLETAETAIKAKLGEHTYGRIADGRLISWKEQHRKGYEVKPTTFRRLSIKEARL